MGNQWSTVADELPPRGQAVVRYGQSIFGPYIDIGEILNKDGFRWADWGVTHWRPISAQDFPDSWEKVEFLPEEYEWLCRNNKRCQVEWCGHLETFHGDDGCIVDECMCGCEYGQKL